MMEVFDKRGQTLFKEYGAKKLEHFFEVTETGDYKMCLRNSANNAVVGTVEL